MRCNSCALQGKCRTIRAVTKKHFRWTFHNIIAHPTSEIAYLLGAKRLSDWLHNASIPREPDNALLCSDEQKQQVSEGSE